MRGHAWIARLLEDALLVRIVRGSCAARARLLAGGGARLTLQSTQDMSSPLPAVSLSSAVVSLRPIIIVLDPKND